MLNSEFRKSLLAKGLGTTDSKINQSLSAINLPHILFKLFSEPISDHSFTNKVTWPPLDPKFKNQTFKLWKSTATFMQQKWGRN